MNDLKVGIMMLLVGVFLMGCGSMEEPIVTKAASENNLEIVDIDPNTKEWIANKVEEFSEPHSNVSEAPSDKGYDYYLKAQSISNELGIYNWGENEDIEKDFENLWLLANIISHEQFVRTAHIDPNGNAKDKTEHAEEWKPVNNRMKQSFEYMKQLLNDIDVAINKNGEGKTFGVTHLLGGDKINEMEAFMEHFEEGGD